MGFDQSHYVPIVKGKQGELAALSKTDTTLMKHFTPLLEIPPIPPKYVEGQEEPIQSKSIDAHVEYVGEKFGTALVDLPSVLVDGLYIETEDELSNGASPVSAIFEILRERKIKFIPTVGIDRVEDYVESVKAAVETDKRGCCIRLLESDLEGMVELAPQVESLLKVLDVKPKDIDLLLDFGPRVPSKAALPYQIDALPRVKEWRTLTVAASSFPVDMSGVPQNSIAEPEREEWLGWLYLRSRQKSILRMPTYGDYTINHPVLTEIDPRIINMSPNIRYTGNSSYVLAKGQAIPRKKKKPTKEEEEARKKLLPSEQYPKLSAKIKNHPSWKGKSFSWGDKFIDDCSRRDCVGSATDWRAVGTCHHIAVVVQQLANLP
jgi:Beta protein